MTGDPGRTPGVSHLWWSCAFVDKDKNSYKFNTKKKLKKNISEPFLNSWPPAGRGRRLSGRRAQFSCCFPASQVKTNSRRLSTTIKKNTTTLMAVLECTWSSGLPLSIPGPAGFCAQKWRLAALCRSPAGCQRSGGGRSPSGWSRGRQRHCAASRGPERRKLSQAHRPSAENRNFSHGGGGDVSLNERTMHRTSAAVPGYTTRR